jgi:hypothetical protein
MSVLVVLVFAGGFTSASAQETDALEFRLLRTFGFQAGLQIQGSFSARVSGPDGLVRVELFLDGGGIGVDEQAPFRLDFRTADFAPGEHRLWVEGVTASGETLRSAERRLIFLTAEQGLGSVSNFLLPIFIVIAAGMLLSFLLTMRSGNADRFRLGEYGSAGGAVCRRCGLPFSRHIVAPNLVLGKLERCPHCGHWAIVTRATASDLEQAEDRYAADRERGAYQPSDMEPDWIRRIDDSRFED